MGERFWKGVERVTDWFSDVACGWYHRASDKRLQAEGGGGSSVSANSIHTTFNGITFGDMHEGEPELPTAAEPDARQSTQPIRAYRRWNLVMDGGEPYLESLVVDTRWDGPILRADHKPHFHTDPGNRAHLGHGIYAYPLVCEEFGKGGQPPVAGMWTTIGGPPKIAPTVEGEVELLGRVVRHERGYRAEAARIARLLIRDLPGAWDRTAVIRKMEARYQCEVAMYRSYDQGRLRADEPAEPEAGHSPEIVRTGDAQRGGLTVHGDNLTLNDCTFYGRE